MSANDALPEDLVGAAFEAAAEPHRWALFLDRFAHELGAHVLNLVLEYPRLGIAGLAHSSGCEPGFDAAFRDRLMARDPWREVAEKLDEGDVTGNGAFDTALQASGEFQRDWLVPQQLRYGLGAVLYKPDGACQSALVGFRRKSEGPFTPAAEGLLKRLVPHLQRALSVHRELEACRTVRDAALETLDRLPDGWILLAQDGSVLANNRSAEQILASDDGLSLSAGRLAVADPAPAERLRQMLGRARAPNAPSAATTLEIRSSRGPLRAVATPLRNAGSGRAAAVLFVNGGVTGSDRSVQRLRDTYGLTHAEARVAGRLAEGQRLSEIARDLGISINTVRGHLKQVFAKTGTHRQAELVRLVLSGPAEIESAAS